MYKPQQMGFAYKFTRLGWISGDNRDTSLDQLDRTNFRGLIDAYSDSLFVFLYEFLEDQRVVYFGDKTKLNFIVDDGHLYFDQ